jgi:microcystin-dependent protein
LDVIGTLTTTNISVGGVMNAFIPTGVIVMWSGSIISIPTGWNLCDGTNGTPDLRDRFLIGAGSTYSVSATGGSANTTLSVANLPNHTHTGTTAGGGSHSHFVGGGLYCSAGSTAREPNPTSYTQNGVNTSTAPDHTHTFTTSTTTGATATSFTNLPPYFALAFIMKL